MAKTFPIRVAWTDADGKDRTKGFDLLPRAQKFRLELNKQGLRGIICVQHALFDTDEPTKTSTYRPGDDIPY